MDKLKLIIKGLNDILLGRFIFLIILVRDRFRVGFGLGDFFAILWSLIFGGFMGLILLGFVIVLGVMVLGERIC